MTPPTADDRRARAAMEAANWVDGLKSGTMSAAEREEFVQWLRESPIHVAESLRMTQLVSMLADFEGWSSIPTSEIPPSDTVVQLSREGSGQQSTRANSVKWRRYVAAAAAGIALLLTSDLLLKARLTETHIETLAAERREITLSDGSVVRMSPSTELRVRLQRQLRSVRLERGEAVFRVAKDHTRPFVVSAARASVQAVGTVFAVSRNADTVVVTVTEGRVAVSARSEGSSRGADLASRAPISLQANERLLISPVGIASPIRHVATTHTPDWEDSQLVFHNAPVAEVIDKFNLRNSIQIRLSDPTLGSRSVSGIFDADDPRSFVEFLTTVDADVRADVGSNEIVVLPRTPGSNTALPRR
jgi:transmembrane sensor